MIDPRYNFGMMTSKVLLTHIYMKEVLCDSMDPQQWEKPECIRLQVSTTINSSVIPVSLDNKDDVSIFILLLHLLVDLTQIGLVKYHQMRLYTLTSWRRFVFKRIFPVSGGIFGFLNLKPRHE